MINITLGVVLGSPSMKYPKNGFKIINITQITKMNPARGFCFIVHCLFSRNRPSGEITVLHLISSFTSQLLELLSNALILPFVIR